jgi:hypothetical protein
MALSGHRAARTGPDDLDSSKHNVRDALGEPDVQETQCWLAFELHV